MRTSLSWRFPEWWTLAISALAWLVLLAGPSHAFFSGSKAPAYHDHFALALTASWTPPTWIAQLLAWSLMVMAMMSPLTVAAIRITAARSLWWRRNRAIAWFLAGYLGLWLVAGVLISATIAAVRLDGWPHLSLIAATAFAAAAVWQLTSTKARALRFCHRTAPIAPAGWRANLDCARYGWLIGRGCLLSCWAMMLACVIAGHNIIAMACASAVAVAERRAFRPYQRLMAALLAGLALLYATAIL
ncbi:MAG TPA: DUF2182 domain-containing protein [Chloroflexota bacterium]